MPFPQRPKNLNFSFYPNDPSKIPPIQKRFNLKQNKKGETIQTKLHACKTLAIRPYSIPLCENFTIYMLQILSRKRKLSKKKREKLPFVVAAVAAAVAVVQRCLEI